MGRNESHFKKTESKIRTTQGGGSVTISYARIGGTARLINFMNGFSVGIRTKRGSASATRGLFRSGYPYSSLPMQLVIIIVTMVFLITSCSSPPLDNATSIPGKMTATEKLSRPTETPTETPTLTPVPTNTAPPTAAMDIDTFKREYHDLWDYCFGFVFSSLMELEPNPHSSSDSQWIEDGEYLSLEIEHCVDRLDAIEYPPGFDKTHDSTLLATKELHNILELMPLYLEECVTSENDELCYPAMTNILMVSLVYINHMEDAIEAFREVTESTPTPTPDT